MRTLIFFALALSWHSCVNAPAWPERDGAEWLHRHGWSAPAVQRVLRGDPLETEQRERLFASSNRDVRWLLARNPTLTSAEMERCANASDDYIRSGLAQNPALPHALFEKLCADPSHTVWVSLARNPSLDLKALLALRNQRGLDWGWFAWNRALPAELERRIRASGDAQAISTLNRMAEKDRQWPVDRPAQ